LGLYMGNRIRLEIKLYFPYTIQRDYLSELDHVAITALKNESLVNCAPK